MKDQHRSLLGHSTVMIMTFVLMITGLVLISRAGGQFANVASAQVGSHLQIAPGADPAAWSDSAGPSWAFDPGMPGGVSSGFVQLRSVDIANPTTTGLTMKTIIGGDATAGFADQLVVTSMALGDTDLLPRWDICAGSGALTLAALASCSPSPRLPIPPGGEGLPFGMTFQFGQSAGNVFQGATLSVRFLFTLADTTADSSPVLIPTITPTAMLSPSATSTEVPAGATTPANSATLSPNATSSSTASATPTASDTTSTVAPSNTAGPSTTPIAPYTGSGTAPDDSIGVGLLLVGMLMLSCWLLVMLLTVGRNHRKQL